MPKVLLALSDPQDAWLRREAKRLGISVSELVRRTVDSRRPVEVAAERVLSDKDRNAMAKPDAPPVYETIVRAKGMFDDCKTLTEMMQRCDAGKETLQKYIAAGVSLQQPVDDDYAFLVTQDAKIGKRMKMDRREQEDG